MSLRDYLHEIARCPSIEALWTTHTNKMATYGFDRLIYGFTRYRTSTSLGDPEDFVILTNHSIEYTDEFLGEGLYYHAPMVHWALANDGACSWTVLHDMAKSHAMTPAEERVIAFNQRMGVTAGYTVSFKSISARSKGAIALTARPGLSQPEVDAIWAEHGDDIKLMNDIAHLKILTLPYSAPNRALTRRQREALEWVGDGKTMQDIAVIMGLTSATVEKHLRLAREALAVETTAQAVMKAAFANQMFIMDV
ncbi:Autoinducer-binding transcriptional regulator, LuxR family protein [Sulfitobacter noctilucicola]|uniref:LuxR family transcriptional regulator n=1 Tax=Sulfitobacter noctilucicola TaxID=1342301 RepID=A0A7W6M7E4_9RHOB|nr:LuxR family transcriptional regulator [Sulfitobacter noctilucicola]KIN65056.1 Autoinducer-binding transcriptional regulator, LuxR family protein [Sulfitobacter noctilucicola]MBB4173804.1 LuxR family transcriptional regulator [Sulfitobacter noctilucicola]